MNKYENIEIEKSLSDIDYAGILDYECDFENKNYFEANLMTSLSLYPFTLKDLPNNTIENLELKSEPQTKKEYNKIFDISKTSKTISKDSKNTDKNLPMKKNTNKNSLKLFGNLFIKSFLALKFKNNTVIEKILQEYEKNIQNKSNFSLYTEFREWVKNKGGKYFQNFEFFSTLSKHCIENKIDVFEEERVAQNLQITFEKILYKLFKYFLEAEIYDCLIKECSKEGNLKISQMSLIPKLLKGLCDPNGIKSWS